MAQTDSRAGFRLPWSSERSTTESSDVQLEGDGQESTGWANGESATPTTDESPAAHPPVTAEGDIVNDYQTALEPRATPAATEPARPAPRKPSKFLADLSKAMQAAAEEARNGSLAQFQAEAKSHVEKIHERSASEAAALRRAADDDVAAVREWSKAEIARVREETENRITTRKGRLESEIEGHAAQIEREIERVHGRVSAFEREMAEFFERLLAEDDPTRIATMAERLPEPPAFDEIVSDPSAAYDASPVSDEPAAAVAIEPEAVAAEEPATEALASIDVESGADVDPDAVIAESPTTGPDLDVEVPADFEVDREAAFAAIQAAAEAAASAEVATDAAERAEAVADIAIGIVGAHDDEGGSSPDFDAAEAEAAASADATGDAEEIPVIGDEALAARLADLLPGGSDGGQTETLTTQVVVTGLVSVASIASFKRHLGRLSGVKSVGVSSGPEGEFLFAVHHTTDIVLRDAIPSLPSFQARVTGSGEGTLNVTAHDPESDH